MNDPRGNSTAVDHVDNVSRGPTVLVVTIIFTVLSFTFTLLRCISRLFIVGRWKLDDWFIVAAWALAFGFTFCICWAVRNGLGLHSIYNPTENELPLRKSEYGFSVLYNPVLMATKTSICLFYLSVAKNQRFFRWGVWATLVVSNLAGVALTLVNAFQCHPANAILMEDIPQSAVCIDIVAIYLASSPVNIVTDLALLLLPMPMLTAMRMPKKQKLILVVTFGFGFFVAVVDIIRIAYLQDAFEARIDDVSKGDAVTSELLNVQDDFPWYAAYSFMWSAVEVHIGIMCANVPGLKPLVARILPTILYDTRSQVEHATWRQRRARNFFQRSCFWLKSDSHNSSEPLPSPNMDPRYGDGSSYQPETTRSPPLPPLNPELPLAQIRSHDFASESDYPSSPVHQESISEERRSSTLAAVDEQRSPDTERQISSQGPERNDSHPMDFVEFLTTPDMPRVTRQTTFRTATTMSPRPDPNPTFFDFYNIGNRKCMTELSDRESLLPNAIVTILFFLWGLSYGLLEQLNSQFQLVANLTVTQSVANHSAYYGAYLIAAPTVGQLVLRKAGFKMTFICGLCIYGVGTLIFWPSAVLTSFPAFLCSNFVVGFGVAVLETAANPFVALCGPSKYAETRLSISQGVQAVGTVLAPLLARKVLFAGFTDTESLVDVQWAYLAIALFDVALAVGFYYIPLPDASDQDFEAVRLLSLPESRRMSEDDRNIPRYAYASLIVATIAMFAYVGGQEVVNVNFEAIVRQVAPNTSLSPLDVQTVGYGTFAAGRFATAALTAFLPPWIVLGALQVGVVIFSSLATGLQGRAVPIILTVYQFCQGGIFPLIYAIGLRGLGRHTKWGAVALTAAISGGAIWPVMAAGVINARGAQLSLVIVIASMGLGLTYPLYLCLYRPARRMVNPVVPFKPSEQQAARESNGGDGNKKRHRRTKVKPPNLELVRTHNRASDDSAQLGAGQDVMADFEKELERESKKENLAPRNRTGTGTGGNTEINGMPTCQVLASNGEAEGTCYAVDTS